MAARFSSSLKLSTAIVRALTEVVETYGVSREALLGDLVSDLANPTRTLDVRLDQLDRLVERAIVLTGDPALGLHCWERASFGAFGAVGQAASVVKNFRAGVELAERYWPLFSNRSILVSSGDEKLLRIRVLRNSPHLVSHRAYMEAAAFALARLLRQCAGVRGVPVGIRFDYPAPVYAAAYDQSLRCPVSFGAECTELEILAEHADHPNLNFAAELDAHLRGYADALLQQRGHHELTHRVLEVLRSGNDTHRLTMEDVAARLGMAERTLRRRLRSLDMAFPPLVQRVLREQAEAMLRDEKLSVKQIAYALGFADPSAFHRAFRRWTGLAPSALRPKSAPPESAAQ
jgi:AraC-like DNA-binding protein